MATKPTIANVEVASDATFASGDQAGQALRLDPGAAIRKQGFIKGMVFVAKHWNFWFNQAYLWFVYLNDLHNSAAFLSQDYTPTGTWTFTPGGGVTYFVGDTYVSGLYRFTTPKTRTVMIPLTKFQDANGTSSEKWVLYSDSSSDDYYWYIPTPGARRKLVTELDIPSTQVVTQVRAFTSQGATAANDLSVEIREVTYDKTTTFKNVFGGAQGTGVQTATDAGDDILIITLSKTMDRSGTGQMLIIRSSDSGASEDRLFGVELTITDVGPTWH